MKHYTKEDLELYRHHQLSIIGRIACAAHLKECPACTKLLGELEHEDEFVHQLRKSVRIYEEASRSGSSKC